MKLTQSILVGFVMLLLTSPLYSKVTTTIIDNAIAVSTDKQAVEGYRGCESSSLKKVPAYIFELQIKKPEKYSTCGVNKVGNWSTYAKQNATDGMAIFEGLPEGRYRVVCLSGEAIGCWIEGTKNRSIVYAKETSLIINLGIEQRENQVQNEFDKIVSNNDLFVFPNPAKNEITIQLSNQDMENEIQISLINLLGQTVEALVYPLNKHSMKHTWTLDISTHPQGTYFIRLTDSKGKSLQEKVLIQSDN